MYCTLGPVHYARYVFVYMVLPTSSHAQQLSCTLYIVFIYVFLIQFTSPYSTHYAQAVSRQMPKIFQG